MQQAAAVPICHAAGTPAKLKPELAVRAPLAIMPGPGAGVAQLVERHVPNVNVEGSSPFARLRKGAAKHSAFFVLMASNHMG